MLLHINYILVFTYKLHKSIQNFLIFNYENFEVLTEDDI